MFDRVGHRSQGFRVLASAVTLRLVVVGVVVVGSVVGDDGERVGAAAERDTAPTREITSAYRPVGPVRLADTREATCGCRHIDQQTIRIDIAGRTDVVAVGSVAATDLVAVAVTITATPTPSGGFVTAYPGGTGRPITSTVNTRSDRVVANGAIIPVGPDGSIDVFQLVPGDVVVDLNGVFVSTPTSGAGRYVAVPTRRLADTRDPGSDALAPDEELTLAVPHEAGGSATAVVVNVTSIDERRPGFLSARPAGTPLQTTSFLNTNGSGQPVAASTIVPVSDDGFTLYSLGGGHVVVDLLGYFTGAGAPASADGLFVPQTPTRLVDTRTQSPRLHPGGTIEVAQPAPGAAIVTNVTVTAADRTGFVTAYPAGTTRPGTSSINPAFFDHTVANAAITTTSDRGLAYWSYAGTDLVVDMTGWFTGTPVAAPLPPPPDVPVRSRVLMVGDSTLAGLDAYPAAQVALLGFDPVLDAASCRRLVRTSCRSDTGRIPNTVLDAIATTPGRLDVVVVKAGFNDWFGEFPSDFDAVVQAAREKGAHTIVWMTLNEDVSRDTAARAYRAINADLRVLTALPQYADVLLADWDRYTAVRDDWFADGIHLRSSGAWALADHISRWIAAIEHRPCERPWTVGGPVPTPCPVPDLVGPVPDPAALYR